MEYLHQTRVKGSVELGKRLNHGNRQMSSKNLIHSDKTDVELIVHAIRKSFCVRSATSVSMH